MLFTSTSMIVILGKCVSYGSSTISITATLGGTIKSTIHCVTTELFTRIVQETDKVSTL